MNCQEFWNNMPQRGQEITPQQASHLAACATCAAQWEPHRALAAGLHSMAEEWRQLQAPPRVEAGLTAAFRAQTSHQRRRWLGQSWWTPVFAWASAAAAMIVLAGFLVRGWQPVPAPPGTVAAPHRTGKSASEMAATQSPTITEVDSEDNSSGWGEGFVRLPNAARIEPDEHVDVVRVAVPGSAMIALGLSVSEDRATETLLADVALGSDGLARAVRLVNEGGSF